VKISGTFSRESVATAYRAMVCIMGLHLGGVSDKCLNSARYTFSGLSDWLPSPLANRGSENL